MSGAAAVLDLGSLNAQLERACLGENFQRSVDEEYRDFVKHEPAGGNPIAAYSSDRTARNLMQSAGPISDAYILGAEPRMLITGPAGSGKTTASVKKALVEAQRIWPGSDGVRRYVLGVWRDKYVNLWKATIPSWWSILPRDLAGSHWVGSPPRDALHVIAFDDAHGRVELIAQFRAFGDAMSAQDLKGNQYTDVYLNEMDTLPEELFIGLATRVGRDPPPQVIRRTGRYFGDANPPDVLNFCYRDFYDKPKPGHRLYRQPGGRDHGAENLIPNGAMSPDYYDEAARVNAHQPWWVRVMVDAKPGFLRAIDPVHPKFDDVRNVSARSLDPEPSVPVIVSCDGGLTPAAAYSQEMPNGQYRVLGEVQIERGGMKTLATAMLALEARRFTGCEFVTVCDPAMLAAEDEDDRGNTLELGEGDVTEGSDRQRLAKHIAREVDAAPSQDVTTRIEALDAKLDLTVDGGGPGLLISGPDCPGIRRGLNQTFHFRKVQGTNDRGAIAKTFDGHVCEALQYGAEMCGTAAARRRSGDRQRAQRARLDANRAAGRYDPLARRRRA